MKYLKIILFLLPLLTLIPDLEAQQRFPKPEFHTEYNYPTTSTPEPRGVGMEFIDVIILVLVMSLTVWFALKKRSRNGILLLTVFSAIYFGFYRNGCICTVGSIQNVALAFADPRYVISLYALLFFLLPLIFTLFFGRVFCGAACPLGAMQDLLIYKPITIPAWLRKSLGFIPYLYLGLSVLYAATGTDFIICRYDPFIGIYRMNGPHLMIFLGIAFLLMGLFIARPYCRFLCPYGALLNIFSRFSWKHLTIYPSKCIRCKLCTTSCPFEAIDYPDEGLARDDARSNTRRFLILAALVPVLMAAGALIGLQSHVFLSKAHPDVYLAELLISHPELKSDVSNIDIQTFLASGKSLETLVADAQVIRDKFRTGSWILGAFLGLVIGIMLLNQSVIRRRNDYQANRGNCYSCARCLDYCPVD